MLGDHISNVLGNQLYRILFDVQCNYWLDYKARGFKRLLLKGYGWVLVRICMLARKLTTVTTYKLIFKIKSLLDHGQKVHNRVYE